MVLDCKSSLLDVLCFCTSMLNEVNRAIENSFWEFLIINKLAEIGLFKKILQLPRVLVIVEVTTVVMYQITNMGV